MDGPVKRGGATAASPPRREVPISPGGLVTGTIFDRAAKTVFNFSVLNPNAYRADIGLLVSSVLEEDSRFSNFSISQVSEPASEASH